MEQARTHVAVAGIDERIEVFKGCLNCVNTVSLTEFTPEFDVAFSTLEHVEAMTTFMWVEAQGQNFDDAVANMERTFSGSSKPKVFVNLLGMAWISDEWFEDGALKRIFMLGPVFRMIIRSATWRRSWISFRSRSHSSIGS